LRLEGLQGLKGWVLRVEGLRVEELRVEG